MMHPTHNTPSENIQAQSAELLNKRLARLLLPDIAHGSDRKFEAHSSGDASPAQRSKPTDIPSTTWNLADQVASWVNEGGAGGELKR